MRLHGAATQTTSGGTIYGIFSTWSQEDDMNLTKTERAFILQRLHFSNLHRVTNYVVLS